MNESIDALNVSSNSSSCHPFSFCSLLLFFFLLIFRPFALHPLFFYSFSIPWLFACYFFRPLLPHICYFSPICPFFCSSYLLFFHICSFAPDNLPLIYPSLFCLFPTPFALLARSSALLPRSSALLPLIGSSSSLLLLFTPPAPFALLLLSFRLSCLLLACLLLPSSGSVFRLPLLSSGSAFLLLPSTAEFGRI